MQRKSFCSVLKSDYLTILLSQALWILESVYQSSQETDGLFETFEINFIEVKFTYHKMYPFEVFHEFWYMYTLMFPPQSRPKERLHCPETSLCRQTALPQETLIRPCHRRCTFPVLQFSIIWNKLYRLHWICFRWLNTFFKFWNNLKLTEKLQVQFSEPFENELPCWCPTIPANKDLLRDGDATTSARWHGPHADLRQTVSASAWQRSLLSLVVMSLQVSSIWNNLSVVFTTLTLLKTTGQASCRITFVSFRYIFQ